MPDFSPDALAAEATRFLAAQRWVSRVHGVTPALVLRGVLGVYRCGVIPSEPDADVMVWVVVGDLPAAYVAHEPGDSWQDALFGYVELVKDSIDPARLEFIRAKLLDVDPDTVTSDA